MKTPVESVFTRSVDMKPASLTKIPVLTVLTNPVIALKEFAAKEDTKAVFALKLSVEILEKIALLVIKVPVEIKLAVKEETNKFPTKNEPAETVERKLNLAKRVAVLTVEK